jgi:hypothetical protein
MNRRVLLALAASVLLSGCDKATPKAPLVAGDAAPAVTMKLHDGSNVTLSSLMGRIVLVYFYPKDDTAG